MNFVKQAYANGADDAARLFKVALQFSAIPAPKPKAGPNQVSAASTGARPSKTITQTVAAPQPATASSPAANTSSTVTLGGKEPISAAAIARNGTTTTAPDIARATAEAGRGNIVADRGAGTAVPAGATPKAAPYASTGSSGAFPGSPTPASNSTTVASGSKAAEFNTGMTPDPRAEADKTPSPDNGRRMYGTQFSDALRPLRDVDQAFNGLNIQKNTDVLNSAGQAEFGAPRG